jgi:chorismate mutase / prephenate dehydratase
MNQRPMDDQLLPLRTQIDALDRELVALLNRRASLAVEVGRVKHAGGAPVFRPDRERQVIEGLAQISADENGLLKTPHIATIWREVMGVCRSLEQLERVAFLGPLGTFSEQAAGEFFGNSIDKQPVASIDEIFRSVTAGAAEYGVVPIENSTEGAIARTLDLLLTTPLVLCGEVALEVRHNLLRTEAGFDGITAVCAHPQALAQCHGWLSQHLPHAERRAVSSNAEGARLAAGDSSLAGIAGLRAASQYGLQVAASNIQDDPNNRTRFGVIGRLATQPSGRDRTSLILSVPNIAGAMLELLKPLAEHGVSMSRFESRPARSGEWAYYFYVDIEGHQGDANVALSLGELQQKCAFYKCLGSYPQAR